jgi:hypothetical protein
MLAKVSYMHMVILIYCVLFSVDKGFIYKETLINRNYNQHMEIQGQPDAYQYSNMHIGDFS